MPDSPKSYTPTDGQIDVFEMLEMVEKEGMVPTPDKPVHERRDTDERMRPAIEALAMDPDDGFEIVRGEGYSFWVECNGERLHIDPFWSQVECWGFIIGWRESRKRNPGFY